MRVVFVGFVEIVSSVVGLIATFVLCFMLFVLGSRRALARQVSESINPPPRFVSMPYGSVMGRTVGYCTVCYGTVMLYEYCTCAIFRATAVVLVHVLTDNLTPANTHTYTPHREKLTK